VLENFDGRTDNSSEIGSLGALKNAIVWLCKNRNEVHGATRSPADAHFMYAACVGVTQVAYYTPAYIRELQVVDLHLSRSASAPICDEK
jgi:hypothetical protein